MTTRNSFKRLVRARMQKTGERYTAARASLLAAAPPADGAGPALAISDDAIRRRTGRGWEAWFDLLDASGALERPHREIARALVQEHRVDGWSAQSITVSYERARGLRDVHEHADGFAVSATRTVAVPVERLYAAFADADLRAQWLPDGRLRDRRALPPKSLRFDWGDGDSRVHVLLAAKGETRSTAAVTHERLPDAAEADRMKAYWRERVGALKALLEA